jgi:hypothetical protein
MRHPNLLVVAHAAQNLRIAGGQIEQRKSEFAFMALLNRAPEQMSYELLSVADSEHRNASRQNGGLDGGAGTVVNAVGPARNDNSPGGPQIFQGSLTREYFGGDTNFPNLASDEMTVLTARVEYRDLRGRDYFFILSTTIL